MITKVFDKHPHFDLFRTHFELAKALIDHILRIQHQVVRLSLLLQCLVSPSLLPHEAHERVPMQDDAIIRSVCDVDMGREIVENAEDDLVVPLALFHVHPGVPHDVYVVVLHVL